MVEMIQSSELLKSLTLSHRANPDAGHKDAAPLIVVPAIVENGKRQSDITKMTGLTMVDIDHVGRERILELRIVGVDMCGILVQEVSIEFYVVIVAL